MTLQHSSSIFPNLNTVNKSPSLRHIWIDYSLVIKSVFDKCLPKMKIVMLPRHLRKKWSWKVFESWAKKATRKSREVRYSLHIGDPQLRKLFIQDQKQKKVGGRKEAKSNRKKKKRKNRRCQEVLRRPLGRKNQEKRGMLGNYISFMQ